ncbi:cytochrome P450 2D26-like isoform X1 [Amblyraja radiata]|uniref:cytochrome P450 2D26-like isoform X1 n=2 Tax=Amblyraja radiata TaxID=386614 RepID=UPI001403645A|nr:cytochrome P450 2D26-like isoform X1 [Amblyraja radiata]
MEFLALPGVVLRVFGGFPALAVFCTVFALAFDLMKRWKKCGNYPPGPRALPFLGNLLQVDLHNPHLSFTKLRKKYGDVMSLDFGWTNMVVLSGYKALKEALVKKSEDFADRPELPVYTRIFKRFGEGIVLAKYGDWWKEQRKFALLTLKHFGLGKKSLELRIVEEAGFLNQAFEGEQGGPFDPHIPLTYATSNVICSIIFGDRFEYHDKWFLGFLHTIEESLVLEGGFWGQLTNTFPFVRHLPGPQNKIYENQDKIIRFIEERITRHKDTWDPDDPRDFIDAFFTQREKMKHSHNTSFLDSNLMGTLLSLFAAGTETTSTTLNWALLFMVLHPDVQSQVHEEIDRVIGNGRKPKLEDREEMPFTNAVIHETQRLGNIGPISLPHQTYRDTEVMGYTIPKGTMIFPNITSVLYDEDTWLTPCEFNPGHFLNSDRMFVKPEAFIPFSAGIAFARYGHWWKEQRKFSLSVMRNFGLGKKSLELRIAEEAEMLNKAFEEEKGLAFDPNFRIHIAVSNIICSIAFGHRFEYQDQKFLEFLHISEESLKMDGTFWGQLFNTFPFIHHLPGPHHKIFEYHDKLIHFLQEIVTEHKKTWDANESRDIIDAFLAEHEKNKNNPKTSFLESNLIGTILDIFTGGTGTISTTLLWALLFMVLHPDVQSQVHEEIDRVIGNGKKPKLEDREKMPFTNAVIHETQRLGNIGPISLPHQTYRDTEVMGYTIPKGTTIIPNITSALFDEDIWLTPHQFNPGHFLNSDGNFVKPEAFIPFSAGHRVCLGEQLAKTELFIFFTSLLQHFTFFLPENEPRPNFREAKYGIILCPLPYRLCAKTR